jgi:hypothetical protein
MEERRSNLISAGIAAAAVFALYIITLSPSTAMWDTSEYMAATRVLGLPHPPGNPFFMLLGHVWGEVPLPIPYAQRINMLAALASSLSAGVWFLVIERATRSWLRERWQRLLTAAAGTMVGATAFTVWNQSVVNEKVYTVGLLFIAVTTLLMLKWMDNPEGRTADRILVLIAYLLGLGYTNHPAGLIAGPAVAIAVLMIRPKTYLRGKLVASCIGALIFGLSLFAYEPIRAAHFPAMNEGEPTGCANEIGWDCTFSKLTWTRLKANINREQYKNPEEGIFFRKAPFDVQVGMYWMYFRWQYLRDLKGQYPAPQQMLATLFLLLGIYGGYLHWTRDRKTFWYIGSLMAIVTVGLIWYLNFKPGWSQPVDPGVDTEVRDRDYFYIWSFSLWGIWVALGLAEMWRQVAMTVGRVSSNAYPSRRSWVLATPVFAVAFIPLVGNWSTAPRRGQTFTREWAVDLLNSVEPYGILITMGDNDTFPLWYAQEVEGVRKDVTVAVTSYLRTDWYVRQLIRRPVYEYDAAKGPAIYRDKVWPKPTKPVLSYTFAQADAVPEWHELDGPQLFKQGSISAVIKADYLTRDHLMVLQMIKDALPERPLYFSSSLYTPEIGLGPYTLNQGIVARLMPDSVRETPETPRLPGMGIMDFSRTLALWEIYRGPAQIIKEGKWVDRASADLVMNYAVVGAAISEVLSQRGDTVRSKKIEAEVQGVIKAAAPRTARGWDGT